MKKEIVKPGTGWDTPETGDKVRGESPVDESAGSLLLLLQHTSSRQRCFLPMLAPATPAACLMHVASL